MRFSWIGNKGWDVIFFVRMGGGGRQRKWEENARFFSCLDCKKNLAIAILWLLAELELTESLIWRCLFLSLITIPVQQCGFLDSLVRVGVAFLTSLQVAIYERFYWGMKKTWKKKGGDSRRWGSNIKGRIGSLCPLWPYYNLMGTKA